MRKTLVFTSVLACLIGATAQAGHQAIESDYPGSWAISDGHGGVAVKVQYLPQASCWRIREAREGVPDGPVDMPTGRHLYITVAIEKTQEPCLPVNTPLETRLTIPDAAGRISLDVFFVDDRGVLQRSQRHRIERQCGASTSIAC